MYRFIWQKRNPETEQINSVPIYYFLDNLRIFQINCIFAPHFSGAEKGFAFLLHQQGRGKPPERMAR